MSDWQRWSSIYTGLSPVIYDTIREQIDLSQDAMKWPLKQKNIRPCQSSHEGGWEIINIRQDFDCLTILMH